MSQNKSDDLLVFEDLAPREKEFSVGEEKFLVKEATEGDATAYRNAAIRATKMADGKVVGMEGVADTEPLLVALCLYKIGEKEGKRTVTRVPKPTVMSWPSRVVKAIFEWIKDNSDLGENPTEEQLEKTVRDAAETLVEKKAVASLVRLAAHLAEAAKKATPSQETNGHPPAPEGEQGGPEGNEGEGPFSRVHKTQPLS